MNRLIFILILSLSFLKSDCQEWTISTVGTGKKSSIAVDQNDRIHIGYLDESFSGYVEYVLIDGSEVTKSTFGQGGYYYGPVALALDNQSNPAITLHDHDTEDEVYFYLDGIQWIEEQISSDNHDGWDNSLAYDSEGNIHTASIDPSSGLEYAYRNSVGWTKVTLGTGRISYGGSTSITIDANNVPHIAYHNTQTQRMMYAFRTGDQWIFEEIELRGIYGDIALSPDNELYVCYLKEQDVTTFEVKLARRLAGSWEIETIDTLFNMGGQSRHATSIAIDENATIHISYGDTKTVKYARRMQNLWQIFVVTEESGSPGTLGALTDLSLDSNNDPHITYYKVSNQVLYAHRKFGEAPADNDNDGFSVLNDCNDNDPNINPGADEIPDNEVDENCDGKVEQSRLLLEGSIVDMNGEGIANVEITSSSGPGNSVFTSNDGNWSLDLSFEPTTLTFQKSDDPLNGISATDLILIRNHILERVQLTPQAQIAADTNGNGSISVTDIVVTTNVLLERINNFPGGKSWIFQPATITIDPTNVADSFEVTGIKLGDTNGSANPKSN